MLKKFINDETGLETMEYAIVGAIVAAVAVLIYSQGWGQAVKDKLIEAASTDTSGASL